MVEYDNLLAHFEDSDQVIEDNLIHDVISALCIAHLFDTVEGALEGCGPVARVEAECTRSIRVDKLSHIQVVW